jgi:proline iminopeptidase
MKKTFFSAVLLLVAVFADAQQLYTRTFGNQLSFPVIFIHGGPGYNSAGFEASAAGRLAEQGFFVIVYDRRGEGRSVDAMAKYSFEQTFDDLLGIYRAYSINKAIVIGHSFGGIVSTLFAEKYPAKVKALVLVSAPVSLQASFRNIISRSKKIYSDKKDSSNLKYIGMLESMDTSSLEYSSYCFAHAMQNGFYTTKTPTPEAKELYAALRKDSLSKFTSQMGYQAPLGFYKNEHYTTINLEGNLRALHQKIPVYAIYGKDDGLYAPAQVNALEELLGKNNTLYLDSCSHNVFIDRQAIFIKSITAWKTGGL